MPTTYKRKYGADWPLDQSDFEIEMACFLRHVNSKYPEKSDQTRYFHYRNIHTWMWPEHEKYFNEWMEKLQFAFCSYNNVTVTGAGGTGKTTESAKYSLVWWRCASHESLVAATSTTIAESKQRIWGNIMERARESAIGETSWGKVAATFGILRHIDEKGKESELNCIKILPGGKEKLAEGRSRLRGWHAKRALLVCDELQDMSKSLIEGAINLERSTIEFQQINVGNGTSWFDPLGEAMTPKDGLQSVNADTSEWWGKEGYVIHLNGLKTPNLRRSKKQEIPYLLTEEGIEKARRVWGPDSMQFWQQIVGFPNPGGNKDAIISAQVFAASSCMQKAVWKYDFKWIFGLDPAYSGGDRCILYPAKYGLSVFDIPTIEFQPVIQIDTSVSDKSVPIHKQIARQVVREMKAVGAQLEDLAMDVTGEGKAVLIEIINEWSTGESPMCVEFGGAASDTPIDEVNKKPANEEYTTKTGELWYSVRRFVEKDQIRGLDIETIREFSERRFEIRGNRIHIEPKSIMKQADRLGYSPDKADAASLVVMKVRTLGALQSAATGVNTWEQYARKQNALMDEEKSYSEAPIA